jgi:hypothetical protein
LPSGGKDLAVWPEAQSQERLAEAGGWDPSSLPVAAQTAADSETVQAYDIPAQPLANALRVKNTRRSTAPWTLKNLLSTAKKSFFPHAPKLHMMLMCKVAC